MFHYMRGVGIPSPLLLLLSLPAVHALHTASDDSCGMRTGSEARVSAPIQQCHLTTSIVYRLSLLHVDAGEIQ